MKIIALALAGLSLLTAESAAHKTPSLRSSIHEDVAVKEQCLHDIGDSNCLDARHNPEGTPCCTIGSHDLTCNYIGGGKDPANFVCQSPVKDTLLDAEEQCLHDIGDSNCLDARHNPEGTPCCTIGSHDLTCNYIGGGKDPANFVCQSPVKDTLLDVEEEQLCFDAKGDKNCYYAHHNTEGKPCCTGLTCNYVGGEGGSGNTDNFVCQRPVKDTLLDVEEEKLCFDAEGDSNCFSARHNSEGKPCCTGLTCNYVGGGQKPANFVCEINGKDSLIESA